MLYHVISMFSAQICREKHVFINVILPILLGKWGPGSLYSREYGDPGSPFSHDTGVRFVKDPGHSRLRQIDR